MVKRPWTGLSVRRIVPAPQNAYARSKHRAEEALRDISQRTGLDVCIVRAPLVVGARARQPALVAADREGRAALARSPRSTIAGRSWASRISRN
jgi:nucleoside-diphosphate-sugar epimerase